MQRAVTLHCKPNRFEPDRADPDWQLIALLKDADGLEGGGAPAQHDREAYSRDLRAFTVALPRIDHRLATGFKIKGR